MAPSITEFMFVTKMFILTRAGVFRYRDPHHTISEKASPCFYYTNQTNSRIFVERDQAARHKFKISRPGQTPIGYPIDKNFNTSTKSFSALPGF